MFTYKLIFLVKFAILRISLPNIHAAQVWTQCQLIAFDCFETLLLFFLFLFGTFSSRNTKVESSFEPRKLHSECIRRVIIKCLYMKYQPMTGFPTQWYIIFINYSNSSGNESDRDNLEIPAATNSSFSGFTGYSPRPKRKIS